MNKYRGEVQIRLAEQDYILRPTLQALCAIETSLDCSLIFLLANLQEKGLRLEQQIEIIYHSLSKNNLSRKQIESALNQSDLLEVFSAVCKYLQQAISKPTQASEGSDG